MSIEQKNVKMGLFFNDKIGNDQNKNIINWVKLSHRNKVDVTVRPTAHFTSPPQIYYSTKRALSNYLKPDNSTIIKILRLQNPQRMSQSRKSSLPNEKSFDGRSSGGKISCKPNHSGHLTLTQSFFGRDTDVKIIRKELEDRFQRTRLILKEEGKM